MREINVVISASIEDRPESEKLENPTLEPFRVSYDGRAFPQVSSGSPFGGCFGAATKEEAIEKLKDVARREGIWFTSGQNPDTGEEFRTGDVAKVRLMIDGSEVCVNPEASLLKWM
jgi:hypothetical protein